MEIWFLGLFTCVVFFIYEISDCDEINNKEIDLDFFFVCVGFFFFVWPVFAVAWIIEDFVNGYKRKNS